MFLTTGPVQVLLLLVASSLLLIYSRADDVTWNQCLRPGDRRGRVVRPQPDNDADTLNLEYCDIENLDSAIFDGLPNLETIWLNNNKIENIDPAIFSAVPNLTTLNLQRNKLRKVPIFENSLLPNLIWLNLFDNQITAINNPKTFYSCVQLQELDLRDNLIEHIHSDVFKPLVNLEFLYLQYNKISYISEKVFQLPSLKGIYLNHNLIGNIPLQAFLGSKIETLHLEYNRITRLPANFISELNSAGANLEIFPFHDNPWHCGSLLEVLAEVKRVGVLIYDNYFKPQYEGKRAACIFNSKSKLPSPTSTILPPTPSTSTTLPPPSSSSLLAPTSTKLTAPASSRL